MIVGEENVLRLHIPVDESVAVRVVERRPDFMRDAKRVIDRQLVLGAEPVAERSTIDERRDVVERAFGLAGIDERHYVRV